MPNRKPTFLIPFILGCLIVLGVALLSTTQAKAQCGSQASSCKNCHETQGQMSVNSDGKSWHTSHAFGDFCYACHGGNNQSMEKDQAHAGMVPPMADVKTACQGCHPNDLNERAEKYLAILGPQAGAAAPEATPAPVVAAVQDPAAGAPANSGAAQVALAAGALPASNAVIVSDANTVDYIKRYEETVLGKRPTNWGNVILLLMIGMIGVGGGYFVLHNEHWVRISFQEKKQVEGEYPADVIGMLPQIAGLKPAARKSLSRLLGKGPAAVEFLSSVDKLTQDDATPEGEEKPEGAGTNKGIL